MSVLNANKLLEKMHKLQLHCNESHIGKVTSKGSPYKDLGSPTLITSFWGVVLPMTYVHYKWCFHWEPANQWL